MNERQQAPAIQIINFPPKILFLMSGGWITGVYYEGHAFDGRHESKTEPEQDIMAVFYLSRLAGLAAIFWLNKDAQTSHRQRTLHSHRIVILNLEI